MSQGRVLVFAVGALLGVAGAAVAGCAAVGYAIGRGLDHAGRWARGETL